MCTFRYVLCQNRYCAYCITVTPASPRLSSSFLEFLCSLCLFDSWCWRCFFPGPASDYLLWSLLFQRWEERLRSNLLWEKAPHFTFQFGCRDVTLQMRSSVRNCVLPRPVKTSVCGQSTCCLPCMALLQLFVQGASYVSAPWIMFYPEIVWHSDFKLELP